MAIAVSDLGTVEDTGADNQSNFSFGSFGAEASDRYLVALITTRDATNYSASSVTIGGTSATISAQSPNTGEQVIAVIAIALVPTGSSGNVVVNWSEAITDDQLCTLLRVTGLSTATAFDTDALEDGTNNPSLAGTIDCEAGGVVIAVSVNGDGRTSTWSLANEASDQSATDAQHYHSVVYEVFASAQTALSVTNTLSGNSANKALAIVALTPDSGGPGAVAPPAANITFAAAAPTVTGNQSGAVAPPAGNIVLAAVAPVVAGNQSGAVAPPAGSITLAALAPAVAGSQSGSVAPPALDIAFTALAPTVSIGMVGSVSPPAADIVFAALAPTVAGAQSGTVSPPAIDIALAALAPAVTSGSSGSVSPPAAAIVMLALAPTVAAAEALTPARSYSNPVVHLLEATPFDESVSETLSAVPAPFGTWAFAGEPEFDIVTGGSESIYAADGWFNSLPSDSPANQHYAPTLLSPFNFQVSLFEGLEPTGRAAIGFGDIVLDNGDGWLDSLIDLGWSGRPIALYRGTPFTARSTFTLVFTGALDGLTPDERTVSLRLRTREALLDRPLQSTLYQGTGGVEGGSDLAGKRKPVGWGRLFNVPAVLIDSANLVYQIHDGEVLQVDAVRDKGVALSFAGDFASYAALIAPGSPGIGTGQYGTCLAQGLIALGGAPDGLVTVDFRGEGGAGSPSVYAETPGGIIRRIVTTRLDTVNLVDPTDLDTDSFDQLATDQPAPIGFWDGPDSSLTVGQALDQIMSSVGGWWTFTLPGKLSVAVLKAPTGAADATLTRDDIVLGPAFALQGGVPSYRRLVGYQRAWAVQAQDSLASGVTAANKLLYSTQYRLATASDAAVLTKHRNAREVLTAGLFAVEADASTEAARLQALHGTERRIVAVGVRPDNPFDAPLGGVVEITGFNRLTLSSSKKFRLIGLVADIATGETTWILWG